MRQIYYHSYLNLMVIKMNNIELIKNLNMEGSPQKKKARFSEFPQIFQYSSKSKNQNQTDNDSLLLDNHQEQARQNLHAQRVEERDEIDSNAERQLEIDQITSDLAEIEAYLQHESKPIPDPIPQPTQQVINLTPPKQSNSTEPSERFSINFRPQLRSGRDTMNLEQELKVRSTAKQVQDDISNNKKRAINDKNRERTQEKPIEERIQQQIRKNKRITMDTKELLSIINDYHTDDMQKIRDSRKNRITMDVFSLAKYLQSVEEKADDAEGNKTPTKNIEKSSRKSKVFSAFKQNPHAAEVKLFVHNYLSEAPKRYQEKQAENKKLSEGISEMNSLILKMDLKISDAKKKVEKKANEKMSLERKMRAMTEQLGKKKYLQDIEFIKGIESKLMMKILKCQIEEDGSYGHFIFDGIFLKIRCKGKNSQSDVKLMVSQEARENEKYFFICVETAIKILKRYHSRLQQKGQPFLQNVLKLRRALSRLKKLDNDLFYLSLAYEVKELVLSNSGDKISFHVCLGGDRRLLMEINMIVYLWDEFDSRALTVYDPSKPGYLEMDVDLKKGHSLVFEKMKLIVEVGLSQSRTQI